MVEWSFSCIHLNHKIKAVCCTKRHFISKETIITRDFMRPEVITSRTPWLWSSFKVSCHTWVVYLYPTWRILTNLALKIKTDVYQSDPIDTVSKVILNKWGVTRKDNFLGNNDEGNHVTCSSRKTQFSTVIIHSISILVSN